MTDRAIHDFSRHAAGGAKFERGTYPQHLLNSAGRTRCYQDANGNLIECAAEVGDYKYYEELEREAKAQRDGRSGSK